MSSDSLSKPLSIRSIASQYTLPVVIRSALGFRGSSRTIILHSISNITFAVGRALNVHQSTKSVYQSYKPIDSELVAIPLQYPGYFECLLPSSHGPQDGIVPERNIRSIVERMQVDHRPQAFYIAGPMRVYTLERVANGDKNRLWHQIEPHQMILFDQIINLEYTPTENDNLTADDYAASWLFCFYKQILNRNESVIKCILSNEQICYIPCSLTDEVCLIPVGQQGSTNVYKLQTIQNLLEQFSLPINIKLAQLPGSHTYKDFNGYLQLFGSYTGEFAICASLSSTNVSLISINTSLKFIVESIPLTSTEITNQLARCQMFIQSFDKQIRRILISSHRSRSKSQSSMNKKQSHNINQQYIKQDDQIKLIDDSYRSRSSTEKRRNDFRKQRAISVDTANTSSQHTLKRTLSTDDNSAYNSLIHPIRLKPVLKQSSLPTPPPLPKKSPNFRHTSTPFTYDTGSSLMKDIDLSNADGAILMDNNNELFPSVASDSRLS